MHELSSDFESLAYNFVHVERVAYNTLAHEIGHNMGVQTRSPCEPRRRRLSI